MKMGEEKPGDGIPKKVKKVKKGGKSFLKKVLLPYFPYYRIERQKKEETGEKKLRSAWRGPRMAPSQEDQIRKKGKKCGCSNHGKQEGGPKLRNRTAKKVRELCSFNDI